MCTPASGSDAVAGEYITPTLYERFAKGFEYVGFEPSPGFDKLIETFARMEVDVPPRLVPGIEETLRRFTASTSWASCLMPSSRRAPRCAR